DAGVPAALVRVRLSPRHHDVGPRPVLVLRLQKARSADGGLSGAAGVGTPGEQQAGPGGECESTSHGTLLEIGWQWRAGGDAYPRGKHYPRGTATQAPSSRGFFVYSLLTA